MTTALTADESSRVTIFDTDGRTTSGRLQTLTSESISLKTDAARSWKWADVVSLRFDVRDAPSELCGAVIWLANGDRLMAKASGIEDERLMAAWVKFADWPELSLPLEAVRGVAVSLSQSRQRRDELAARLLDRREARDELRLLNGDLVAGELTAWQNDSLTLRSGAGNLTLPLGEIRDIGFNPELLTLPEPKDVCWLVSLSDGSRVTLRAAQSRLENDVLKATHITGVRWDIPLKVVCELRVLRGRAVFLSDLTPAESRYTTFLPGSREWPLQRDRSVAGRPLRVGGTEFPKGLGMHSRSVVSYDLAGKYRAFAATIGLDDTTSGNGTVACLVEVDGHRAFAVTALSRGDGPRKLPLIDLAGAKRLTLIVDFGELGDVQDHVDWCDAVLLR